MIEVKLSTKEGVILFEKRFRDAQKALEWGDERFANHPELVTMVKREVKRDSAR